MSTDPLTADQLAADRCPACGGWDVGPFCVGCGGLCTEKDYSPHWIVNVCLDCGWDNDPEHQAIR